MEAGFLPGSSMVQDLGQYKRRTIVSGLNQNTKLIGVVATALVVVIMVFACLNRHHEEFAEGKIVLKAGNEIIGEIMLEDVKRLPAVEKKLVIDSTEGFSRHNFTCTELREVFNYIDPQIVNRYKRVITRGVDNYVSGVNMEEVQEENNVYLVYADNGEPLVGHGGETGTMRIVILNDLYGQRFTNYLVAMELE